MEFMKITGVARPLLGRPACISVFASTSIAPWHVPDIPAEPPCSSRSATHSHNRTLTTCLPSASRSPSLDGHHPVCMATLCVQVPVISLSRSEELLNND